MSTSNKTLVESLQELTARQAGESAGKSPKDKLELGDEDPQVLRDVGRVLREAAAHTKKARKAPVGRY